MQRDLLGPAGLFTLFAGLAALGAHLAVSHLRGRRAGLLAAGLTLAFFALLGAALAALLGQAGLW